MSIKDRCVRISNYFKDGPFWQKRWISFSRVKFNGKATYVRCDPKALSKEENPNWRFDQKWAVLCFPLPSAVRQYHVLCLDFHGQYMGRTLLKVKTRYFAMRVGPGSLRVLIRTNKHTAITPRLLPNHKEPLPQYLFTIEEILEDEMFKDNITFI